MDNLCLKVENIVTKGEIARKGGCGNKENSLRNKDITY